MLKILFYAYREWAIELVNSINHPFKCLIQRNDYTAIKDIKPNIIFFIGWSEIVPKEIIEKNICICLHPSLLPKYRGGSPIQHQIMNGEEFGGVTLFRMNEVLDGGDILYQMPIGLEGELNDIFNSIKFVGKEGIGEIIKYGIAGIEEAAHPQRLEYGTILKRRKPEESEITLNEIVNSTALQLHNKIRALADPYPNAYIKCKNGEKLYITKSRIG